MGGVANNHRLALVAPLLLGDAPDWRALRVEVALAMHMWPAILLALFELVQLLGLHLIPQEIDAMIEPPKLTGLGVPVIANSVAQPGGENGARFAIRADPQHCGVFRIAL